MTSKCKQLVINSQYNFFIGFSIISIVFSEDREKYLGIAEATQGIGLMIGPVIGSFFYADLDFIGTFQVFAAFLLLNLVCIYYALPDELNNNVHEAS